jgi:hypothetical protein
MIPRPPLISNGSFLNSWPALFDLSIFLHP